MLLHLLTEAEWTTTRPTGRVAPESLQSEGFVHCCADAEQLLGVANRFYTELPGEVIVLEIDEQLVGSEVRFEAPAHPDGSPAADHEPRFPHIYGPVPVGAVVSVRRLDRDADGRYVGLSPATDASADRSLPG